MPVLRSQGSKILDDEINQLEQALVQLQVPLPPRPPLENSIPSNTEVLRDKLMFRIIHLGIQNFLIQQTSSFLQVRQDSKKLFQAFTDSEMTLGMRMRQYGKLKGWTFIPPDYNQSK